LITYNGKKTYGCVLKIVLIFNVIIVGSISILLWGGMLIAQVIKSLSKVVNGSHTY
jgi:hypothetical protein